MLIKIPNGLDEIIHVFGSLDDQSFRSKNVVIFRLPYTLFYAGKPVNRASAHRRAVDNFVAAFKNIQDAGLANQFTEFNGIYEARSIRGQESHPSTHSWGIAVDMQASKYPLGSHKRMPDGVIGAFRAAGFFYGGDFKSRKDPQHFQLATGY